MVKNIDGLEKDFETLMALQSQLKGIKAEEIELRKSIANKVLETKEIGTHTITSGVFICKATKKVAYLLDRDALEQIWADLSEDEKGAIDYQPKLKLKDYKSIDSSLLDEAITIKPAMPSIAISYIGE
jgi:hypothetical protein